MESSAGCSSSPPGFQAEQHVRSIPPMDVMAGLGDRLPWWTRFASQACRSGDPGSAPQGSDL